MQQLPEGPINVNLEKSVATKTGRHKVVGDKNLRTSP